MSDQTISHYEQGVTEGDYALEHAVADKTYVLVAVFLAVMTGLEVLVSYTKEALGPFHDWALIILMAIKFICVCLYFMHLKFDHAMCKRVFFFGLSVAVLVYCGMLGTFQYWASGFR